MNTVLNYVKNYAGHLFLFAYTCEVINADYWGAHLCLLAWIVWKEWKCMSGCCKRK